MYWWKRIKDLREDNDLTRLELAKRLDISERTLSRYESGESEPTISFLIKMSLIFNVSIDYLCCIKEEPLILEEGSKQELLKLLDRLSVLLTRIE